jgi:hypothetical protein
MTYFGPKKTINGLFFLIDAGNHLSFISGDSSISDVGGTKTVGSLTNITSSNQILNFDGINSAKILFSSISSFDNLFDGGASVEVWIRPQSDGQSNFGRVLSIRQPGEGFEIYVQTDNGSTVDFCLIHDFTGDDGNWCLESSVELSVWNHVVMTYNSNDVSNNPIFYLNGTLRETNILTTPTLTRSLNIGNDLNIGNRNDSSRTFDGDINYLSLYNKELSPFEVAQNYYGLKKRFGHV